MLNRILQQHLLTLAMRNWERVKLIGNRFRKRGQESRKPAPVTEIGSKQQQQQPRREQARGEVRIHPPGSRRIGTFNQK